MQTSQSVQSPCDNKPKNVSLADDSLSANTFGLLIVAVDVVLFCWGKFGLTNQLYNI